VPVVPVVLEVPAVLVVPVVPVVLVVLVVPAVLVVLVVPAVLVVPLVPVVLVVPAVLAGLLVVLPVPDPELDAVVVLAVVVLPDVLGVVGVVVGTSADCGVAVLAVVAALVVPAEFETDAVVDPVLELVTESHALSVSDKTDSRIRKIWRGGFFIIG
jgi:hypothetical protein